jgi:hypothetical protein
MAKPTLEERVTALEKQLADLKESLATAARPKDWRRTIGMFADDEFMREVFEEARKYREKDRERVRRRYDKNRRAKP